MVNEIKHYDVHIRQVSDDTIVIGIKRSDTDPLLFVVKGTLQDAVDQFPKFLEECKQKWEKAPKNPATTYAKPAPPPPAPRPASKPNAHVAHTDKEKKKAEPQQAMF